MSAVWPDRQPRVFSKLFIPRWVASKICCIDIKKKKVVRSREDKEKLIDKRDNKGKVSKA